MNHNDNNDQPSSPASGGRDHDDQDLEHSQEPRRLEPVFSDPRDTTLETSDFVDNRYSAEYEDDTIDYDVDPEAMMEDGFDDELDDFEGDNGWHADELKPELVRDTDREPELDLAPATPQLRLSDNEEDDTYYDDQDQDVSAFHLPLGLIVVAIFALLLLGAGGYGVIQQRADMQEQIRTLQAEVATATSPDETTANREALRDLQARNADLQITIDQQELEIQSLQDTAKGMESQLNEARAEVNAQALVAKEAAAKKAALASEAPKPVPAKTAPAQSPTAAPTAGDWFVNFSSYRSRETANSWARRLQPKAGKVVVITGEKDGSSFFRVRVIGLADKQQAESIARALEQEYDLTKLWVGKR